MLESQTLLHILYGDFYRLISKQLSDLPDRKIVELGSGLGNIHDVIPNCIRTDLFPNPWIDQVENAYQLSFADESVSNLILTDVFHHLRYPSTARNELYRVVCRGGRVIMLEPCISALGLLVYGALHVEPIATTKKLSGLLLKAGLLKRWITTRHREMQPESSLAGNFNPF